MHIEHKNNLLFGTSSRFSSDCYFSNAMGKMVVIFKEPVLEWFWLCKHGLELMSMNCEKKMGLGLDVQINGNENIFLMSY